MTEESLSNPEVQAQASPQPVENRFFRSRSLLFVLLRIFVYIALSTVITFVVLWILPAPTTLAIGEGSLVLGALGAGLLMSLLESRPFGDYGLPLRGAFGKLFWQGALFGLAEISTLIGLIAIFGSHHFGSLAIHGSDLLRWTAFWAAFFVVVGLYEEFAFRGYVQFTLAQAVRFWPAAVLLSVAFGLVHMTNPGESKLGVAGVMLTGLLWCFALRRTGNLWFAVGMHASFDFGETFLYSVPDSGAVFPGHLSNATLAGPTWLTGGSTGPEASVCDFVILLVLFYVIHRLYPARVEPSGSQAAG